MSIDRSPFFPVMVLAALSFLAAIFLKDDSLETVPGFQLSLVDLIPLAVKDLSPCLSKNLSTLFLTLPTGVTLLAIFIYPLINLDRNW